MQGMSERQYAAHVGLSRGAIQKAKTAERLVLYPDGSINAAASDARRGGDDAFDIDITAGWTRRCILTHPVTCLKAGFTLWTAIVVKWHGLYSFNLPSV